MMLTGHVVLSQNRYTFDYYTVYEYQKDTIEKSNSSTITFSNSKNYNYNLFVHLEKDTINATYLIDHEALLYYKFSDIALKDLKKSSFLSHCDSYPINMDKCRRKRTNFYEVIYFTENGTKKIDIKRFQNKKKKKLLSECFIELEPTTITKHQQHNFPPLTSPLACGKFTLNSEDLISKSYFVEEGKIVHLRKLTEIKNIEFTLTIAPNTIK